MTTRLFAGNRPAYDKDLFSKYLKIRENSDNQKFIRMIRDVNDYTQDFEEVFEKYFNLDNYLTWIAMNLLLDNYDTASRNFLLFSPSYSDKWYFLPWDYDKDLLSAYERKATSLYNFFGLERYWGTVFHNRFFAIRTI
jgi:spore coat protein H